MDAIQSQVAEIQYDTIVTPLVTQLELWAIRKSILAQSRDKVTFLNLQLPVIIGRPANINCMNKIQLTYFFTIAA